MPASLTFSASTNQITSPNYTYDAAGDLTEDYSNSTTHTYQWDAEGRVSKVDSGNTWTFTYDAVGDRVAWVSGGTTYDHLFDPAGNWLGVAGSYSIAMLGNRPLTIYNSSETWFHHVNNIASRTFMVNHYGTPTQDMVFYPFGGLWLNWGGGGLEFADLPYRDTTTNTDLTMNRVTSPNLGRWHSPDPIAGNPTNPQSWNMYAYVANNPTTSIDPLGLCSSVGPGGGFDCSPEEAAQSNYSDPLGIFGILGGGGGGGGDCTMDGSPMSCGFASVLINQGAAAPCPGNVCSQWGTDPYTGNETYLTFYATAGGSAGYLSMYDWTQGVNDVNGTFLSNVAFQKYLRMSFANAIASQLVAVTIALQKMGTNQGEISNFVAYVNSNPGSIDVEGGNANFPSSGLGFNFDFGCPNGRCDLGDLGTLDFSHGSGSSFHLDTGDPYTDALGAAAHFGVDLFLGNSGYWVIPR